MDSETKTHATSYTWLADLRSIQQHMADVTEEEVAAALEEAERDDGPPSPTLEGEGEG